MRRENDDADSGRVVADMTGVGRRNLILPGWPSGKRGELEAVPEETQTSGSVYQEEITSEQRRWYILGAMKAALMIGAVYAVGFGIAIFILLLIWNH